MVTTGYMLAVLDDAIATNRWWRRRPALELVGSPTVLGEAGRPMGFEDGRAVYGFSRAQCKRMRDRIMADARDDARPTQ